MALRPTYLEAALIAAEFAEKHRRRRFTVRVSRRGWQAIEVSERAYSEAVR